MSIIATESEMTFERQVEFVTIVLLECRTRNTNFKTRMSLTFHRVTLCHALPHRDCRQTMLSTQVSSMQGETNAWLEGKESIVWCGKQSLQEPALLFLE